MKKRWIAGLLTLTMILGLTACGQKKEETPAETQTETTTETESETVKETETPLEEGKMYSYMTGEVVDTQIGTQRLMRL